MLELELKLKDGTVEYFSPLCSETYEGTKVIIWNGFYDYEYEMGDILERNYKFITGEDGD